MASFNVLSFNIDTNITRTEDGFATKSHANWRIAKRIPEIIKVVRTINPDIIHFQEGRIVKDVNSVEPLVHEFEDDYHIVTKPYNPTEKAFIYISCFRKTRFDLGVQKPFSFYLTDIPLVCQTDEQMKEYSKATVEEMPELKKKWIQKNGFEEFEKSFLCVVLQERDTQNKLMSINAHLGISEKHRLFASQKINEIFEMTRIFVGPNVIMTGDFNTFPDWKGPEQLEKIIPKDLSKKIRYIKDWENNNTHPVPMKQQTTFHFFPYDYGVSEKLEHVKTEMSDIYQSVKAEDTNKTKEKINNLFKSCCNDQSDYPLGGQLDHIFYAGVKPTLDYATLVPAWTTGTRRVPFESDALKEVILEELEKDHPALASDHQPLFGIFTF